MNLTDVLNEIYIKGIIALGVMFLFIVAITYPTLRHTVKHKKK